MKIAIIGGIGCGKSRALDFIKASGYFVLSADKINAELLQTPEYVEKIAKAFPSVVENGVVNKANLASIVFNDEKKRAILNSIAHPEIAKKIREFNEKNIAVELPLALESGVMDIFDKVILIDADESVRLERLEKRGLTVERAKEIMRAQVDVDDLKKIADIVIDNNGDVETLENNIKRILNA